MPATDDLSDAERTTEELADIMFSGNVIEVLFAPLLIFRISLSGVDLFVRHSLTDDQIADLAGSFSEGEVRITMPPAVPTSGPALVEAGEAALLNRALQARNMLLGR
ncbi:hypothetical protein [Streptomyces sp. WM6378]|uniref:hypothetical protein n=1 Tax=Streptomyces sp. WM6378 TaxID=1415557 RepID=UPI0006AF7B04|nr:hypothetical protein [Streptomyces sp. WM6378]KOU43235.1 hypothetical protein ADK54_18180 [Streptomyces sp. WM6378]